MNKEEIIRELDEIILKKLNRDNKREYCIDVLQDIELNMEDSEVVQFVARKIGDKISYENKEFFHTMREFQPREQRIEYTKISLIDFSEDELSKLLKKVKDNFDNYTI